MTPNKCVFSQGLEPPNFRQLKCWHHSYITGGTKQQVKSAGALRAACNILQVNGVHVTWKAPAKCAFSCTGWLTHGLAGWVSAGLRGYANAGQQIIDAATLSNIARRRAHATLRCAPGAQDPYGQVTFRLGTEAACRGLLSIERSRYRQHGGPCL